MKSIKLILAIIACIVAFNAKAVGWPAGFEGVMLQGFYWDSYQTETKWSKLEARADELSASFKLIWVPNSGKSTGGLGYIPIYWFTNHNSDMGSENALLQMIKTYKAKGTGIIADFVINHRGGASNWTDFPAETWNGKTWKIGLDGICRTDEVNNPGNPGGATGRADEGQDFDGGRDLDHTNANVQENCKNYAKCLLEKYGYVGFRLDMVKGYAGYYTKMYNQYAKPTYCVGEYWDGSYDALAAWIESTGWESAAFDFAFKYAVNEAFATGDMTKLVWLEDGVTPKPAGLIHHWYQQMAVTFIDNHDTARDDWNKFNGNIVAANAFMLMSPGTPCVFLPHWNKYKDELAAIIAVRNEAGISNTSDVRVLEYNPSCYMAEITGSKGKAVVKIGPAVVSPAGYSDSEIRTLGTDYCIWLKGSVPAVPSKLYLIGDLKQGHWTTNNAITMTKNDKVFTASGVEFVANTGETKAFFSFVTKVSTKANDWDTVNSSVRYGATSNNAALTAGTSATVKAFVDNASDAYAWGVKPGVYDVKIDFGTMKVTLTEHETKVEYPESLYVIGNLENSSWATNTGVSFTGNENIYEARNVYLKNIDGQTKAFFSFATKLSTKTDDWTTVNSSARYGAKTKDLEVKAGSDVSVYKYSGTQAASTNAWSIAPGHYDITVDLDKMTMNLKAVTSGVEAIEWDAEAPTEYFDLTGRKVVAPQPGHFYIRRQGANVDKVVF